MHIRSLFNLVFEISELSDRSSCHIRNTMRHGDERQVFSTTAVVARLFAQCRSCCRSGARRRGTGPLNTCVHVRLVVVTDVKHVIVSFKHPREAAKADICCAAVTSLGYYPDMRAAFLSARLRYPSPQQQ